MREDRGSANTDAAGGRRSAWLASVAEALRDAEPLVDEAEAGGLDVEDLRARIAAAQAAIALAGAMLDVGPAGGEPGVKVRLPWSSTGSEAKR